MRVALRFLLTVLLLGVASRTGQAQVRPDLDWQTLSSTHFRVHFTSETEALARRTIINAERAYAVLSTRLTPPRGVIELVVADNADYANGYATPFPDNRIVIYARPPIGETALRNHGDWNLTLVTHELVHIFHLDRVRGMWGWLQRGFGRAAPLFPNLYAPAWVTEGLAVHYESQLTTGGRLAGTEFPALVRAAAYEDALPPLDALSLGTLDFPLGNTAYLYGAFAMTRADDAQLGKFVEVQSAQLLPWRLDAAAHAAFGISFTARWREWRDSVRTAAAEALTADSLRAEEPSIVRSLTSHVLTARYPRFTGEGDLVYVADDGERAPAIYRVTLDGVRRHVSRRHSIDVVVPRSDDRFVLAELDYTDPYSVMSSLKEERLGGLIASRRALAPGERLSHPDVHDASGRIVAVRTEPGTTDLVLLSDTDRANGATTRTLARGTLDLTWGDPRFSRAGDRVAAVRWERGGRMSVVVLDLEGREQIRFSPRVATGERLTVMSNPAWVPGDTALVFVSDHEGRPLIYWGDVRSGAYGRLWTSATGLHSPDVSPDGRTLAAVELRADGYHVVSRPTPTRVTLARPARDTLPPVVSFPAATADLRSTAERYSPWGQLAPTWFLPSVRRTGRGKTEIGGFTGSSDILGRHAWFAQIGSSGSNRNLDREVSAYGSYTWAGLGNPVVQLEGENAWAHGNVFNQTTGARIATLAQQTSTAGAQLVFNRPRVRQSAWAVVGGEFARTDYRTYPRAALPGLSTGAYSKKIYTGAARVSVGFSTLQRATRGFAGQDGVTGNLTVRQRFGTGVLFENINEIIASTGAAKSLPWGGHARHAIAVRVAGAIAGHATTNAISVGGVSGSSLELLPGISIGSSQRTFGVRGFDPSSQLGARAFGAGVEYRAPLFLIDRGYRFLQLFLQRTSFVAFGDAGGAWCTRAVPDSFVCPAPLRPQQWLGSVGGELTIDASPQYDQIQRFRIGLAPVVHGKAYAPRALTFYFSLGSSF
ncbi:MAG: hypothetical protein IT357_04585 [Gemmatimonadaceae bacterium]|nr:hypothetical protein [Gemmatimonadaceae bacterium]